MVFRTTNRFTISTISEFCRYGKITLQSVEFFIVTNLENTYRSSVEFLQKLTAINSVTLTIIIF